MNGILQDARRAIRGLLKAPIVSVVIVLSLALGIGANSAIFSLINSVFLQSLPVHDPSRLFSLHMVGAGGEEQIPISLKMFLRIRNRQSAFSGLFASVEGVIANIDANGSRYPASVSRVSDDYFDTLGVTPILGRFLGPDDIRLEFGHPAPVAVLDYGCWVRRFNADPAVCGKSISINGETFQVIGVTPKTFHGIAIESAPEVTVPLALRSGQRTGSQEMNPPVVIGRLRPGITAEAAAAQLATVWPRILADSIPTGIDPAQRAQLLRNRVFIEPAATGTSYMRERLRRPLGMLMNFVSVVLLIACANLANLMLARSSVRKQEFGIRLALGSGRWLVVRQLLLESVILALSGGALALIMARFAARWLANTFWTGNVPLTLDPSPDPRVLLFTGCIAVFTGVLFGIIPALWAARTDPVDALCASSRTTHRGIGIAGKFLIGLQVCLSLILVLGAIAFTRTLWKLRDFDPGFRRENVLAIQLFQNAGHDPMTDRTDYYRTLSNELSMLTGVECVSYSHVGPITGYEVADRVMAPSSSASAQAIEGWVGPGFFNCLGMHLISGREFAWMDNERSRRVAILSESLARQLFPGGAAVGQTIDADTTPEHKGLEIIGVVNSASLWTLRSHAPKAVYIPLTQEQGFDQPMITMRVRPGASATAQSARSILNRLGRHYPLRIQTLQERTEMYLGQERVVAMLATLFGGLALLLASIGIYGVMSFAISRRKSEIGVRMALGASPSRIHRMMVRETAILVSVGLAAGISLALAALRFVVSMLYGVSANDPAAILGSAILLLSVGLLAGYFPARRASHIEPMRTLQAD